MMSLKMKLYVTALCLLAASSSEAKSVKEPSEDSGADGLPLQLITVVAEQLQGSEKLKSFVDSLGIQQDFVKPLEKMLKLASKLNFKSSSSLEKQDKKVAEIVTQFKKIVNSTLDGDTTKESLIEPLEDILNNGLPSLLGIFLTPSDSESNNSTALAVNTLTNGEKVTLDHIAESGSDVWLALKSTWQKILAHVEDSNSMTAFMRFAPFRIIDRIFNVGDNVNLMGFLAQKLEPSLAEFIVKNVSPYLGPMKDFESFYNFTMKNGFSGVLDYFGSKKFKYTFNTMSRVVTAYLENAVTNDIVDSYIDFISFDNMELHNFYKAIMESLNKNAEEAASNDKNSTIVKRDILTDIASMYKFNDNSDHSSDVFQNAQQGSKDVQYSGFSPRSESYNAPLIYNYTSGTSNYVGTASNTTDENSIDPSSRQLQRYGLFGASSYGYDPSRDGGYGGGGGGYGMSHMSMSSMDPYLIIGSLILGALLGFLLFRALRGTRRGRRDINDGSLSLWQSDMPDSLLPGGSNAVERMKRSESEKEDEFSLSSYLRGDTWSTDPLIGEEFMADLLDEDDIADHLNSLWKVYQDSNETACVQSYLCDFMTNNTAEQLAGKDSSVPLLMASLSNMIGVSGPGQLFDDVTKHMVAGNAYTCNNGLGCHFSY